jgi:thiamine transport system ATP-binding protein
MPLLELDGVVIASGDFRLSAAFGVGTGRRVAILGPSGAGKSTLLKGISGFSPVIAGAVRWQGRDLVPLPPGERPISILFQDQNLFPHLDVAANVALGLRPSLRLSAEESARVEIALVDVGLRGYGSRRPPELSGGEAARVALARALIRARPLLLLDEPFAALGPGLRREMLDLVATVLDRTGATLLMVTHDPRDAERLCPEAILVAEGRANPPVPTQALLANPPPPLADYLGRDRQADRM